MKDAHSWVEPLSVDALRLIELLDLFLKHCEKAAGRITGFEPASERVREKIAPCALFVCFQGIIENKLEVGRCGSRVSGRHKAKVRNWGIWGVGNGEREERHASRTCR
jgi:hypothetical protein